MSMRFGLYTVLGVWLAGCATTAPPVAPPPETAPAEPPAVAAPDAPVSPSDEPSVAAIPLPSPDVHPDPRTPLAVQSLLTRAERQQAEGDAVTAVATLERAVRIAPHAWAPYVALAELKQAQQRYAEAEQWYLRALNLPGVPDAQRRAWWQQVAACREARGDTEGARQARTRAAP